MVSVAVTMIIALAGCARIGASPVDDPSADHAASSEPTASAVGPTAALPSNCTDFGLTERRCGAVIRQAAKSAAIDDRVVDRVELLQPPAPSCGTKPDGTPLLCNMGGPGPLATVRFHLRDGGTSDETVGQCIGGETFLFCHDPPRLNVYGLWVAGGDSMVVCASASPTNPEGCSTAPSPGPLDASAVAAARRLDIERLEIPVPVTGPYDILVGTATLANGIATEVGARADQNTTERVIEIPESVQIALTSTDPTRPDFSMGPYRQRVEGVEEVTVRLVFEVGYVDPGSVLVIQDLVVR